MMQRQIDDEPSAITTTMRTRQKASTFPIRLYDMLEDADKKNFRGIVSWLPSGNAFKIHQPQTFVELILPHYFRHQTHYKSFTRQLNLYEFRFIKRNEECPSSLYDNSGKYIEITNSFQDGVLRGKSEVLVPT
jgi:hypothetical protein